MDLQVPLNCLRCLYLCYNLNGNNLQIWGIYMAKKKQKPVAKKKQENDKLSLGDLLNKDVVSKLKDTQKELKEKEQQEQERLEEQKRRERREREKNKSFEELLNESSMTWKDFK